MSLVSRLSYCLLPLGLLASCSQKPQSEIPIGTITTLQEGTVIRVREVKVDVKEQQDGAFANMAGSAAEALTPGIIATGTSKFASATGNIMDTRVNQETYLRVRLQMDGTNELIEVFQKQHPDIKFKVGQKAVITKGSSPGNVWPD
jgi:outer membrane lipoprotein SlyB